MLGQVGGLGLGRSASSRQQVSNRSLEHFRIDLEKAIGWSGAFLPFARAGHRVGGGDQSWCLIPCHLCSS